MQPRACQQHALNTLLRQPGSVAPLRPHSGLRSTAKTALVAKRINDCVMCCKLRPIDLAVNSKAKAFAGFSNMERKLLLKKTLLEAGAANSAVQPWPLWS